LEESIHLVCDKQVFLKLCGFFYFEYVIVDYSDYTFNATTARVHPSRLERWKFFAMLRMVSLEDIVRYMLGQGAINGFSGSPMQRLETQKALGQ